MKIIITYCLLICFTTNLLAQTLPQRELQRTVDEFQYAITVDWDQTDAAVYQREVATFVKKVSSLLKSKAITPDDLLAVIESKLSNKSAAEALRMKMDLVNSLSGPELTNYLAQSSTDFYLKGASWNGKTAVMVAGFVTLLAGIAFYAFVSSINDDEKTHYCKEYGAPYYQCHSSDLTGYSWCGMQSDCLEWGYH